MWLAKPLFRIVCFQACLFGHSPAWAASMDDYDEAEIEYSDARILANDRKFDQALPAAERAYALDSLHVDACYLVLECARVLGRDDLIKSYSKSCWETKRKRMVFDEAVAELEHSQKRVDEGNLKEAMLGLNRVLQLRGISRIGREDIVQETWFRMGMIHLKKANLEEAIAAFRKAGSDYNQRRAYLQGLVLWRKGFPREAIGYFTYAATRPPAHQSRRFDPEIAKEALDAIRETKRTVFGVTLATYLSHDSNPFSVPRSTKRLTDGTPNRAELATADLGVQMKGFVPTSNRWSYRLSLGVAKAQPLQNDYRRVLGSESAQTGVQFQYAKLAFGKLFLKHSFQYGRSPVQLSTGEFETSTVSRLQSTGIEYLREWGGGEWQGDVGYQYVSGKFLTPSDSGLFDRSGPRHHAVARLEWRSPWDAVIPSLALSRDWVLATGDESRNLDTSLKLANRQTLSRDRLQLETSIARDWVSFPRSAVGRTDKGWRYGLALVCSISARWAAIGQLTHYRTESTDPFYKQDRTVLATGVVVSY